MLINYLILQLAGENKEECKMKNLKVNGNVVERLEEALDVLKKLEAKEIEEFDFSMASSRSFAS